MPDKVISVLERHQGLDGGVLAGLERVTGAFSDCGAETVWAEGAHIADHGKAELGFVASGTRSCEHIGLGSTLGHVVVSCVFLKATDDNMVVVRR